MKMSDLFSQTLRETPGRKESPGVQLLLRAGYLHSLVSGGYAHLPLGLMSIRKMENDLRQSLLLQAGQEISFPLDGYPGIDPTYLNKGSKVILEIISRNIHSYRQLPKTIFHFGMEQAPKLMQTAEILRMDRYHACHTYALVSSQAELDDQYGQQNHLLETLLKRWELPFTAVPWEDPSMLNQELTQIYYPTELGEETILRCPECGYLANRMLARFFKGHPSGDFRLPLELVPTPGVHTIQSLADFLGISTAQTAKAVLFTAGFEDPDVVQKEQFIFAVIRGDLEVNEIKLARLLGADSLRPASDEEIRLVGAEPGYASPIGLINVRVILDDSISISTNLVAGSNQPGHHFLNVNYGRDYSAEIVADIALGFEQASCPICCAKLSSQKGALIGSVQKLGVVPSNEPITYLDSLGQTQPIRMAASQLDLDRILACSAQEHHDDKGLVMPVSLAPYQVFLVVINSKNGSSEQFAENFYHTMLQAGLHVLLDDRPERAGVKFNDADLIGLPLRLTVGERSLQENRIEIKPRHAGEIISIPPDETLDYLMAFLQPAA